MSTLKENLLELVDSTLDLLNGAEQIIEVRGAIRYAKQVKGCVSQCPDDIASMAEVREVVKENIGNQSNIVVNEPEDLSGELLTDVAPDTQEGLIADDNTNEAISDDPNDADQDTLEEKKSE